MKFWKRKRKYKEGGQELSKWKKHVEELEESKRKAIYEENLRKIEDHPFVSNSEEKL